MKTPHIIRLGLQRTIVFVMDLSADCLESLKNSHHSFPDPNCENILLKMPEMVNQLCIRIDHCTFSFNLSHKWLHLCQTADKHKVHDLFLTTYLIEYGLFTSCRDTRNPKSTSQLKVKLSFSSHTQSMH